MKRSFTGSSFYYALGAAALLVLWWAGSAAVGNNLLLPPPEEALRALLRLLGSPDFSGDILATASRVLKSVALSFALGLATGLVTGAKPNVRSVFAPTLAALRTVPFISLSVLAIIWFPSGTVPVFVAFLMAFPAVVSDVSEGMSAVDKSYLELAKVYKVPAMRIVRGLYLPSLMPYLVSALSQAAGMSWKIVVSAEVLSIPGMGIGGRMDSARAFLDTPELFAWTMLLVAFGFAADAALATLRSKAFRWREGGAWKD